MKMTIRAGWIIRGDVRQMLRDVSRRDPSVKWTEEDKVFYVVAEEATLDKIRDNVDCIEGDYHP